MHGRAVRVGLIVTATLAVPATAGAATKTVQAGPFGKTAAQGFQQAVGDANQFFRRTVTIHKGDRVKWKMNGFHAVTFVPGGVEAPALIVPDPANPVTGVLDAASPPVPFWFNGQPNLSFNPEVALKQGGGTFNPDKLRTPGCRWQGPPPAYKLKFKQKGRFTYLCIVHPGMAGSVRVVGTEGRPSRRKTRTSARRREQAKCVAARCSGSPPVPTSDQHDAGRQRPAHGPDRLQVLPARTRRTRSATR